MKKIHSILAISAAVLAGTQSVQAAKTFYSMAPDITDSDMTEISGECGSSTADPEVEEACTEEDYSNFEITPFFDRSTGSKFYELCYTTDELTVCGKDLEKTSKSDIAYYWVPGTSMDYENAERLELGKVHLGGIDLTNPAVPKIDHHLMQLQPGTWTLFAGFKDKIKKVTRFRQSGSLGIVTGTDVETLDSNGVIIQGMTHSFNNEIVAGNPTPIYITSIFQGSEKTYTSPMDAIGIPYSVYTNNSNAHLYEKKSDGSYSLVDGQERHVNGSGVDTLYIYMEKELLSEESNKATIILGSQQSATVNFKAGTVLNKAVMGIQPVVQKTSASKSYAIYNMQGQLIKKGLLTGSEKLTVPTSGTYMVRMGNTSKVVKFK